MTDFENVLFPFTNADDDEFFEDGNDSQYENYNFKNFDHTDYKLYDIGHDIDPENNFYNTINNNCQYYTEEQYKQVNMIDTFSIIHFNSRSLNKNIGKIKKLLAKFKKFSVIAVSETWLTEENCQNVDLVGYDLFTSNRNNKTGGGVALYVDSSLRCSIVNNMITNLENIFGSTKVSSHQMY